MSKVNDDIFKPNSDKSKAEAAKGKHEVEKVTQGKVSTRKEPLGRKMADTFFSDAEDVESIKHYIFFEKIVPAIVDLTTDIWQGIPDMIFGNTGSNRSSRRRNGNYNNYGAYYRSSSQSSNRPRDRRASNERSYERARTGSVDYRDIIFDSRADAEEVLEKMLDVLDQYDAVSLVDLYSAAGITSRFTDDKFGWDDLSGARVVRVRGGGYSLDLPRPIVLD